MKSMECRSCFLVQHLRTERDFYQQQYELALQEIAQLQQGLKDVTSPLEEEGKDYIIVRSKVGNKGKGMEGRGQVF